MFNRILIPLDGSTLAERAIPHAEAFARIFGASIVLIRVLEVTTDHENQAPVDPLNWQIRKTEAELYLRGIASRIRAHLVETEKIGGEPANQERVEYVSREAVFAYLSKLKQRLPVDSEIRVVEGNNVTSAIQELADQEDMDLILISAHGYTGQFTYPYGNVARSSIERGTKSILVLQDVPLAQVRSTVAAVAAEKSGIR